MPRRSECWGSAGREISAANLDFLILICIIETMRPLTGRWFRSAHEPGRSAVEALATIGMGLVLATWLYGGSLLLFRRSRAG